MDRQLANCPVWLEKRIKESEGKISFSKYMDLSLNDPINGAYSSGRLKIGKKGDFATSPSLGSEFADLLAVQIVDWFRQLDCQTCREIPLTLIDIGPGEGHLSRDLIKALAKQSQNLINRIQLILVEPNEGMIRRQKVTLEEVNEVPIFWKSLEELVSLPVVGIVIAHELLDALPVERLVFRNDNLYRQGISLLRKEKDCYLDYIDLPLTREIKNSLEEITKSIGLIIPPEGVDEGWCTEWHCHLNTWFDITSKILLSGALLIVDYALEAFRYYTSRRSAGTIMAYRNNVASGNVLQEPGFWDITSHLCLETLRFYAKKNDWNFLGEVRQGQALLSLGLSEKLYSLQMMNKEELDEALERRENLLRLVDPVGLGEFRWVAFQINKHSSSEMEKFILRSRFLEDPIP